MVADEERQRVGDFLGRRGGRERVGVEVAARGVGRHPAQDQRVGDDAVALVLARDRLHEDVDGRLGGAEQAAPGRGILRRAGGDDDEPPARARLRPIRLRQHRAQRGQREVVGGLDKAAQVGAQVLHPRVDQRHDPRPAGEADQPVDAAEALDASVDRGLRLRRIVEIGRERNDRSRFVAVEDAVDRGARTFERAREHEHPRALPHQRRERRATDPAGRTGHHDRVTLQLHQTRAFRRRGAAACGGGARKHVTTWSLTTPTACKNA